MAPDQKESTGKNSGPRYWVIGLIHFYQAAISPFLPVACRHQPTCSGYAIGAIEKHGLWKGGRLTLRRLCRCHRWGTCGYDPVP